jgi:hypothetical protein
MPQPNDFLVKREEKSGQKNPAEDAVFTYFGPVGTTQRFRFLVLKEAGDLLSVLPGAEARFKTGLKALRWDAAEGGTSTSYMVLKTKPNRIDLRKTADR